MKMIMPTNVYLMCGLSGSGKDYFLTNELPKYWNKNEYRIISRDDIRFSLLKKGENYFAHEKEVVKLFWEQINSAIESKYNVFINQTSISKASRKKILSHISEKYDNIYCVWIDTSLEQCIENNKNRQGLSLVPQTVIEKMAKDFETPELKEGFDGIFRRKNDGSWEYY